MTLSDKDIKAVEHAFKRFNDSGYAAFFDLKAAVEQLGQAFKKHQVILVRAGDLFSNLSDLSDLNERYFEHTSLKEHGTYRQFEKRDKRKNFR